MIDRQKIEARKADLQEGLRRLEADLHATTGAIQDCDFWLAQLAEEEAESAASSGPKEGTC